MVVRSFSLQTGNDHQEKVLDDTASFVPSESCAEHVEDFVEEVENHLTHLINLIANKISFNCYEEFCFLRFPL